MSAAIPIHACAAGLPQLLLFMLVLTMLVLLQPFLFMLVLRLLVLLQLRNLSPKA